MLTTVKSVSVEMHFICISAPKTGRKLWCERVPKIVYAEANLKGKSFLVAFSETSFAVTKKNTTPGI